MSITEEDIKMLEAFITDETGLIPSSVKYRKVNKSKCVSISITIEADGIKFSELIHRIIPVLKQLDIFMKHKTVIGGISSVNGYITVRIYVEDNENLSDIITLCKLTL